jgi:hypothetical protein
LVLLLPLLLLLLLLLELRRRLDFVRARLDLWGGDGPARAASRPSASVATESPCSSSCRGGSRCRSGGGGGGGGSGGDRWEWQP